MKIFLSKPLLYLIQSILITAGRVSFTRRKVPVFPRTRLYAVLYRKWSSKSAGFNTPLTPARDLTGTWKTAFPVTVNIATDWCTEDVQLVGTQPWDITFVITSGVDENHVNVQMSFTVGSYHVVSGCSDTGFVPEVSPMFLTGTVSSSNLILEKGSTQVGNFNFTTDILTGTFDYTWTAVWSQREYTATNGLTLTRQ